MLFVFSGVELLDRLRCDLKRFVHDSARCLKLEAFEPTEEDVRELLLLCVKEALATRMHRRAADIMQRYIDRQYEALFTELFSHWPVEVIFEDGGPDKGDIIGTISFDDVYVGILDEYMLIIQNILHEKMRGTVSFNTDVTFWKGYNILIETGTPGRFDKPVRTNRPAATKKVFSMPAAMPAVAYRRTPPSRLGDRRHTAAHNEIHALVAKYMSMAKSVAVEEREHREPTEGMFDYVHNAGKPDRK